MRQRVRLERSTEDRSVAYAVRKRCVQYKLNGLGRRGKTDRVFATPNGYTWWVEFKREKKVPRRLQEIEAKRLRRCRQLYSTVWSYDEFCLTLDQILRLPIRRAPRVW